MKYSNTSLHSLSYVHMQALASILRKSIRYLKRDIARNLHALLGQRESDAGLAPEILFLKDSVLSFAFALTAPGRYLIASHNAGFSWYGNAFDMQLWLLNVNGRFAE